MEVDYNVCTYLCGCGFSSLLWNRCGLLLWVESLLSPSFSHVDLFLVLFNGGPELILCLLLWILLILFLPITSKLMVTSTDSATNSRTLHHRRRHHLHPRLLLALLLTSVLFFVLQEFSLCAFLSQTTAKKCQQ